MFVTRFCSACRPFLKAIMNLPKYITSNQLVAAMNALLSPVGGGETYTADHVRHLSTLASPMQRLMILSRRAPLEAVDGKFTTESVVRFFFDRSYLCGCREDEIREKLNEICNSHE